MNKYFNLILEKSELAALKATNNTIFSRIVLLVIILFSLIFFVVIFLQYGGGFWLLILSVIAGVNLKLSYSKNLKFVEFANFFFMLLLLGILFSGLIIISFWIFLFR